MSGRCPTCGVRSNTAGDHVCGTGDIFAEDPPPPPLTPERIARIRAGFLGNVCAVNHELRQLIADMAQEMSAAYGAQFPIHPLYGRIRAALDEGQETMRKAIEADKEARR